MTATMIGYSPDREILEPMLDNSQIRLTVGGGGWMGTFAKMAAALVNDILEDGEPITATLVTEEGRRFCILTGLVRSFIDNVVTFEDGVTVDAELLLSVTI